MNVNFIKKTGLRAKFKKKVYMAWNWFYDNKDLIIAVTPIVLYGGRLIKGGIRTHNLRKEQYLKDMYVYDRSLGHYWKLKRKLSTSEWLRIDKRYKTGERLSEILNDMNVLK